MKVLTLNKTAHDLPETELIIALNRRGIEVSSILPKGSVSEERFRVSGIKVHPIELSSKFNLKSILAVRKLVKESGVEIVHAFDKTSVAISNFATLGLKTKNIAYRGIVGNLSLFDPISWLTFLNPKIDRLVCVCLAIERFLKTQPIPKSKIQTIYKGHLTKWYSAYERSKLGEFGIPDDAFVVSCTANVRKRKGLSVLVEALNFIPQDLNIHYLLIGEVQDQALKELIGNSKFRDRIHLSGYRKDVTSIVGATDLNILPSLKREGLPKGVIEAMAQGIPAVVTNVGGMPELVEDGVSGKVIPAYDSKALAQAIVDFRKDKDLLVRSGCAAKERIEKDFYFNDTLSAYLELYKELMLT